MSTNNKMLQDMNYPKERNCDDITLQNNNTPFNKQYYKFISPKCDNESFHPLKPLKYYQIAGIPNYVTHTYDIRITNINSNDEIIDVTNGRISRKIYKYIIRNMPSNKYKVYATDMLYHIPLPKACDITLSRSCLLK